MAQVIDTALGTGAQYCWQPSIERGLMRITLSEADRDEGIRALRHSGADVNASVTQGGYTH